MNHLLSIIIPVYNVDKYINDCFSSLNKQRFDDEVEIILVDDGSTDNSSNICDIMVAKNSRIKVIHQHNQGVSAARNRGLKEADGKYIAWIDPDDYIADDWWETIHPELMDNPDMIYFDMYTFKNGVLREFSFDKKSRYISHDELCKELAVGNRIQSHLWSKIILRDFFDQSFSTKQSYSEDYAIMHHILWSVKKCKYIHKPLYIYRQVPNSIVNTKENLFINLRTGIKLNKQRYRFYKKKGITVPDTGIYLIIFDYCYHFMKKNHNKGI